MLHQHGIQAERPLCQRPAVQANLGTEGSEAVPIGGWMKRSEKKVLVAIMNGPCTLDQLFYLLRLPTLKIRQAVLSLRRSGDIQFDGTKFSINRKKEAI